MLRLQSASGVKSANPRTDRFTAVQTRGVQCCFTCAETVRTVRDPIQTDNHTHGHACRQAKGQTDRLTDGQNKGGTRADRERDRNRDRERHRDTDRETETQTDRYMA